jgi:hypothetical protein
MGLFAQIGTILVIPGRRAAANPESIFQRPVCMGSGFAALQAAPRNDGLFRHCDKASAGASPPARVYNLAIPETNAALPPRP